MNCPCTPGGELAKRLRSGEEQLRGPTGYVVKIVERAGEKVVDQLHKTNPWRGEDCNRQGCHHCWTKIKTSKYKTQCCKKRSLIYETWCISCEEKEIAKIKNETEDEKERKSRIAKIKLHKYVGETARTTFERGFEHINDKKQLSSKSHMLKHCLEMHREEKMDEVEFGIRTVRHTRTSFERQILESVIIQENRNHHILNSKSEYNRCALPRLTTKIGENDYKKWEDKQKEDAVKEKEIESQIRDLRMKRYKTRQPESSREEMPANKKRKTAGDKYKKVFQKDAPKEKRKEKERPDENPNSSKRSKLEEILPQADSQTPPPSGIRRGEESTPDKSGQILFGPLETVEILEFDYVKHVKEHEEKEKKEEEKRKTRIEIAARMEKSWELMRCLKEIIKENSPNWETSKEKREKERIEAEKKAERKEKAREKKEKTMNNFVQKKITDALYKLPEKERNELKDEEIKVKRLELKEAKENVWKKWRNKKEKNDKQIEKNKTKTEILELKLDKIEKALEKIREEKENEREKLKREMARRRKYVEENKLKENERIIKEKNKKEKIQKKHQLEKHWELMRWICTFIENHREEWEENDKAEEENKRKLEEKEKWEKLTMEEKGKVLERKAERKHLSREELIEKAKKKRNMWTEWRGRPLPRLASGEGGGLALESDEGVEIDQGVEITPDQGVEKIPYYRNESLLTLFRESIIEEEGRERLEISAHPV